jgi:hypothetical protein
VWKQPKVEVAKLCIAASNRNWQHIGRSGHDKLVAVGLVPGCLLPGMTVSWVNPSDLVMGIDKLPLNLI